MYIQSKNGRKIINLDQFDYLELDENEILAYKNEKYMILGEYNNEIEATKEFEMISEKIKSLGDYIVMQ